MIQITVLLIRRQKQTSSTVKLVVPSTQTTGEFKQKKGHSSVHEDDMALRIFRCELGHRPPPEGLIKLAYFQR